MTTRMTTVKYAVAAAVAAAMLSSDACTAIVVGKKVSPTGRVIVGHNEDDGRPVWIRHGVLPATAGTLRTYWQEAKFTGGDGSADSFYNERGVFVCSDNGGGPKEKFAAADLVDGGVGFEIRRDVGLYAKSARDAVRIIGELVEKRGYRPGSRIYTVADRDEAWQVQLTHGFNYVAVKCPDDAVTITPNVLTVRELSAWPKDSLVTSKNLLENAKEKGWWNGRDEFDFARVYQAEFAGERYRASYTRHQLAQGIIAGRVEECTEPGRYPFAVKPANGVCTVEDVKRALAAHIPGFNRGEHDPGSYSICRSWTIESAVCEFAADPLDTVLHVAVGSPCETPYAAFRPFRGLPAGFDDSADAPERLRTHLRPAFADFFAADLTKLDRSRVKVLKAGEIEWIKDGRATMPIVAGASGSRRYTPRGTWEYPVPREAAWLAQVVFEMTGVRPRVIVEDPAKPVTNSPAVYVGSSACKRFTDALPPAEPKGKRSHSEEFRVVSEKGSLYFAGLARHGVADFAERYLGVREYWDAEEGGRYVVKTDVLPLPEIDYTDEPVYPRRETWPFSHKSWYNTWKAGNSWLIHCDCHQPHTWWRDTNFNYRVTRPEIFQLGRDGNRQPPMLCYGNPKTFETYKERLELELAGGPRAGMYNAPAKTVTVSQWDGLIDCQCEYCKKLYDHDRGTTGNASPIIWGFAAKLADWLHEKHPEITVTILPYLNTCDVPKGLAFPHGNVEAEVCSMPGLALFKNADVREHEEKLIKDWAEVTGRPIRSWNYLCWPAEFCNAPYVFGHTAVDHYRRMKGLIVGAFVNGTGTPPERRAILSQYVWLRALWNPELDVEAVYDGMCERMFGPAAKPMRRVLAMQEAGWNRQWGAGQVSNKNVYDISYPRKEVVEMENLVAEARRLSGEDKTLLKRLDRYTEGFKTFFEESKNLAEGTALEPTLIKKAGSDPIVDGRLDDDAWKLATPYPFVHATDRKAAAPKYASEMRAVWTPNGVTFGFRFTEPYCGSEHEAKIRAKGAAEEVEIFLDPSGTGDGHYYQIWMEDIGTLIPYADAGAWMAKGVTMKRHLDKGWWSMEVFVPFDAIRDFPKANWPHGTSAEGIAWSGNFIRFRRWDGWWGKGKQLVPGSVGEFSRRYTRYSIWSKDASAFGRLQFVE